MEAIVVVLRYANAVAFTALAVLTYRQWRVQRDRGSMWAFLAFLCTSVVLLSGLVLPDESGNPTLEFIDTIRIAIVLLFPYFLYRMASYYSSGSRLVDALATLLTAALVAWAVIVPRFPDDAEPRPRWYVIFLLGVVVQWVLLSALVSARFWIAGRTQPAVARNRMRMLSVASLILTVAIVVSATVSGEDEALSDTIIFIVGLMGIVSFFMALAPPQWLRASWRRPTEEALRAAMIEMMGATEKEQVVHGLLPHAAAIVAGEGIAVVDNDGVVIGAHGFDPADIPTHGAGDSDAADRSGDVVHLPFAFGSLLVKKNRFTTFFGSDEIALLGFLGALANLAFDRVAASKLKLQLAEAHIRRQQALEINDNVVQGLAVAKYAFELQQMDKAQAAIDGTLAAARSIISDLLNDIDEEDHFAPGALIRGQAASGMTAPAPGRTGPHRTVVPEA